MMHIHDSKQPFARGRIARAASMIFTLVVWLFSAPPTSGAAREDVMGITGGTLLWEDQFDQAQRQDIAVAVAAQRGVVVAAGTTRDATGNRDILVRAYDGLTGSVLWQSRSTSPAALPLPGL